jgi:hypothetical protein
MVGTRDYVNSTLIKIKPRRHRLLTRPSPMAQQHSPPYSSPSPMWLIVVSSAVVTRHRGRPQPSSSSSASSITSPPPSPLYCCAFFLLLPHFPLRSPSPLPSPSSSYLHRIMFDCCVLSCSLSCCLPSPPQDPRQHRRHTPQPPPPSSYPLCSRSLIYLIVACIRD